MGMLLRRYHKTEDVDLSEKTVKELRTTAKDKGIEGYSALDKEALIEVLKG